MLYEMYLDGKKLPVLPENQKEKCSRDNKKYDVLNLGEVVRPGKRKLRQWSISSVFYGDEEYSPDAYRQHLEQLLEKEVPVEFIYHRYQEDGAIAFQTKNVDVVVERLEFEDREGEPGTLYFTVKLLEYRPFGAVVL